METGKELNKAVEKNFSGKLKINLLNLLYTPRPVYSFLLSKNVKNWMI